MECTANLRLSKTEFGVLAPFTILSLRYLYPVILSYIRHFLPHSTLGAHLASAIIAGRVLGYEYQLLDYLITYIDWNYPWKKPQVFNNDFLLVRRVVTITYRKVDEIIDCVRR